MLFSRRYTGITVCLFQLVFISFSVSKSSCLFRTISQNDKITFSDTKSYPDCTPVGSAEKVDLFRYLITRRRGLNYSKQSLQFQIGQIGDSEKRILKYGKQLTSFELQRSSCFLKKSPSNQCTISLDGENGFLFCHCDRLFLIFGG